MTVPLSVFQLLAATEGTVTIGAGYWAVPPAQVYVGESWFDHRPAIVLDYADSSVLARHIRDEIREVDDGLYLGIAYWDEDKVLNFSLQFGEEES